jgi:hypothetical protein
MQTTSCQLQPSARARGGAQWPFPGFLTGNIGVNITRTQYAHAREKLDKQTAENASGAMAEKQYAHTRG